MKRVSQDLLDVSRTGIYRHHDGCARRHMLLVAVVVTAFVFLDGVRALQVNNRPNLTLTTILQRVTISSFVSVMVAFSDPSSSLASPPSAFVEWNLGNGVVRLSDPLTFPNQKPLSKPRLLGSGGGGAVFSFDDSRVVVKVSWAGSTESVERECSVLKTLEKSSVKGVERCLGQVRYPDDIRRVMIALEPLVEDAVASPAEIDAALRPHAIESIVRTMVQMLAANVVTVDVQPLISKQTGDVVFIDLTEAKVLKPPLSFLDEAIVSSFCTEMAALIPESLLPIASKALVKELKALEQRGVSLSKEAFDALSAQPFSLEESPP